MQLQELKIKVISLEKSMHIQQNGQTGRDGRIAELTHETQQQNIYQMSRKHADGRPLVSNLKSFVTQPYAADRISPSL